MEPRHNQLRLSNRDVKSALAAANSSKPNVINVVMPSNASKKFNICIFGCQGSDNPAPKKVAQLINETADQHPDLAPHIKIILGDNFYPDGVDTPTDARFEKQFHRVYGNPELEHIHHVPCLVVLGNHDEKRDTITFLKADIHYTYPPDHKKAAKQQVAHSMLPHLSDPESLTEPKSDFFQRKEVNYEQLPKHLMPHEYHSWIFGNLQVFCLNSNTYVKDFLTLLKNEAQGIPTDPDTNQAAWLRREYAEAKRCGRKIVYAMHHPLFSVGKRAYPNGFDASFYLTNEEITHLHLILKLTRHDPELNSKVNDILNADYDHYDKNANYNEFITRTLYDFEEMPPDIILAAHDHSIYYANKPLAHAPEKLICQVVAGGGGNEELQDQYLFDPENVGCYIKDHGYVMISYDPDRPDLFEINIFTINGERLHFTNESSKPICQPATDERVNIIRNIVLAECDQYQQFLREKQEPKGQFFNIMPSVMSDLWHLNINNVYRNVKSHTYNTQHTFHDVSCMHTLINYFNRPTPENYEDTITFLYKAMENFANKTSENSIYKNINETINEVLGNNIELLYKKFATPPYLTLR